MINNAGTGGTESAGKIHDMAEETWDFTMYAIPIVSSVSRLILLTDHVVRV